MALIGIKKANIGFVILILIVGVGAISCQKKDPTLSHLDLSEVSKEVRRCIKEMQLQEDSICRLKDINIARDVDSLVNLKRKIINKKIKAISINK